MKIWNLKTVKKHYKVSRHPEFFNVIVFLQPVLLTVLGIILFHDIMTQNITTREQNVAVF